MADSSDDDDDIPEDITFFGLSVPSFVLALLSLLRDAFDVLLIVIVGITWWRSKLRYAVTFVNSLISEHGYRACIFGGCHVFWLPLREFLRDEELGLRMCLRIVHYSYLSQYWVYRAVEYGIRAPLEGFRRITRRASDAALIAHHFNEILRPGVYRSIAGHRPILEWNELTIEYRWMRRNYPLTTGGLRVLGLLSSRRRAVAAASGASRGWCCIPKIPASDGSPLTRAVVT